MSQALGTFENNWTLDCVCDNCNGFFSRELELPLGRDSIEGFLRVDYGMRPPDASEKFLNRRMRFIVDSEGLFKGTRVEMRSGDTGMIPVPVPQVGFRSDGGDWKFIREKDLDADALKTMAAGNHVEVKILGSTEDIGRLRDRLHELNFFFEESAYLKGQVFGGDGPISVAHDFVVDTPLRRAAAKIVFNYAAYLLGCELMRRKEFDEIKDFVRYGREERPVVSVSRVPILVGDGAESARCHACGIQWLSETNTLVGVLKLFNEVTYGVRLSGDANEKWANVGFQHLFDPFSRKISSVPLL